MKLLHTALILLGIAGQSLPVFAQTGPDQAQNQESGWTVQLTPYVWATALSGEVRPLAGGPKLDFDESFADVLENLDGAFFLTGLARKDRLVLFGDLSWSSSSQSGVVGPGVPASGRIRQIWGTVAGGYRVAEGPEATLDLLLGARAWNTNASVSVPVLGLSAETTFRFVDPLLMARSNLRFAPRWSALIYGDIGGFGVGSDQSFQVLGTLNYQVSEQFFLSAGYRYLTLDYKSDDGRELDLKINGPVVGATWRF
jgi:opacity protein-like surface antigen